MQNVNKKYKIFNSILFIIWPFMAFISNMQLYKNKKFWIIFSLFGSVYGYYWVQGDLRWDLYVYIDIFKDISNSNIKSVLYDRRVFESFQFIYFLLAYLISLFTSNEHILVAVLAFIYSYFFCKSFQFLTSKLPDKTSYIHIILIFCFTLNLPFWGFSGFRYWTSCFVFFYGFTQMFFEKKYIYIFLMILCVFLHFSFLIYNVIAILFFMLKSKNKIILSVFCISVVYMGLAINVIQNFPLLSLFMEEKAAAYISSTEERATQLQNSNVIKYIYDGQLIVKYLTILVIFYIIRVRKKLHNMEVINSFFNFVLLFFAFTNIVYGIPSLYNRSSMLLQLFLLLLLFLLTLKYRSSKLLLVTLCNLAITIFTFFVIYLVSGLETINPIIFLPIFYLFQ
jgi:hypothetical protein